MPKFFERKLNEQFTVDSLEQRSELERVIQTLLSSVFIRIKTNNTQDAFRLFESLNNRGMPLTVTDILKNKLLSQAQQEQTVINGSVEALNEKWQHLADNILEQDNALQVRFFRHYYHARKAAGHFEGTGFHAMVTRSNIIPVYEKIISTQLAVFTTDLFHAGVHYNGFIHPEQGNSSARLTENLTLLKHIEFSSCYALLLYLRYKNVPDTVLCSVVELLIKIALRRQITDSPALKSLDIMFMEIMRKLEEQGIFTYDNICAAIIQHFQQRKLGVLDDVSKELQGDMYGGDNTGLTRNLLCLLELTNNPTNHETTLNLWKRTDDGKKLLLTIEHILAQNPRDNSRKKWIDMVANGDEALFKTLTDQYKHKLGNLTLTGYNSRLSDGSFDDKKHATDQSNGGAIGYNSGRLWLNGYVKEQDTWGVAQIQERTTLLANQLIRLLYIEGMDAASITSEAA